MSQLTAADARHLLRRALATGHSVCLDWGIDIWTLTKGEVISVGSGSAVVRDSTTGAIHRIALCAIFGAAIV